jgi:hypothetical protein
MSWFSKNYEKAALGGAVAASLALAYVGWSKLGSVEVDFSAGLSGQGNNNAAVRDAELIQKSLASLKFDRAWAQAMDGDRAVDLFTGVPLFVSKASPERAVDLYRDAAVHAPIPNLWWIQNHLDPGFADSPNRDSDQDGFSNLEEFNAKTDPNDANSVPSLMAKLMFVKPEILTWVLRPGNESEGKFSFNYIDSKNTANKTSAEEMIAPGGLFFSKGAVLNRFKMLDSEVRSVKQKFGDVNVTFVRIEDQRPNKKGKVYELPAPLSESQKNNYLQRDGTAVFSLEALGMNGKEFKVEEGTSFALPPNDTKKDFLLKAVTPESVTVEYTSPTGEKKTFEIRKGSLPQSAE